MSVPICRELILQSHLLSSLPHYFADGFGGYSGAFSHGLLPVNAVYIFFLSMKLIIFVAFFGNVEFFISSSIRNVQDAAMVVISLALIAWFVQGSSGFNAAAVVWSEFSITSTCLTEPASWHGIFP